MDALVACREIPELPSMAADGYWSARTVDACGDIGQRNVALITWIMRKVR
jgi:hypothetical protein